MGFQLYATKSSPAKNIPPKTSALVNYDNASAAKQKENGFYEGVCGK